MPREHPGSDRRGEQTERNRLSSAIRRRLRAKFGLFPLYELKNRCVLGPRAVWWRRFENAEVARLRPSFLGVPSSECVTVIPTFRRPELLVAAVRSALAQTFEDNLIVVVDDGGGLHSLPHHPRVRAVSLSRNTHVPGLVRNVGIRLTESKFIAFLDDDNTWKPNHLETAIGALCVPHAVDDQYHAPVALVYTALERRFPDGTLFDILSRQFDRRCLADGAWVDTNSIVVRRDRHTVFSRQPRVDTTLPKEDWEFVYRLSRRRRVEHVPVPTVEYLINDASYHRLRPAEWAEKAPHRGGRSSQVGSMDLDLDEP